MSMTDWDLTTRDAPRARRNRQYHQVCPITYGQRRGPTNEALDRARSHVTIVPKHCGCQACVHGFTHIAQVVPVADIEPGRTLTLALPADAQQYQAPDLTDMFDSLEARWVTE